MHENYLILVIERLFRRPFLYCSSICLYRAIKRALSTAASQKAGSRKVPAEFLLPFLSDEDMYIGRGRRLFTHRQAREDVS